MATYNQATNRNGTMAPGPTVTNTNVSATYVPPGYKGPMPLPRGAMNKPGPVPGSNFVPADPLLQQQPTTTQGQLQSEIQRRLPFVVNNGNPGGANNMAPSPGNSMSQTGNLPPGRYPVPRQPQPVGQNPSAQRRAYLNQVSGQQADLGRYRPPTLAGNGNDPMNWNDYGGYDYNLPSSFGPTPNSPSRPGPYGGYPQYLQPNWRNMLPGGG